VPKTLAIAYSDMNGTGTYDTGDVLISKLVDTNLDGMPGKYDTIFMGMYPTTFTPVGPAVVRPDFEEWRERSHTVTSVERTDPDYLIVSSAAGGHRWTERTGTEAYSEDDGTGSDSSLVEDGRNGNTINYIWMNELSPSRPFDVYGISSGDSTDQPFVDVELYY
jgi:hypothetical protein